MTEIPSAPPSDTEVESLARLICGFRATGAICAAAQLNIPDIVADEGASPSDVAREVKCNPDSIYRLLRALASLGIFQETRDGRFVHTHLSRLLKKGGARSLHGLACLTGLIDVYAWSHILSSLRDGRPVFDSLFGAGIFDYMKERPEVAEAFDAAMEGFTEVVSRAVLNSYDFSPYSHIIDIGGGNGSMLKQILGRFPQCKGTIYDLDHVVARAMASKNGSGVEARLDGIGGNFLESVPPGADLYTIKIVLCDWSDDDARRILGNVRRVIGGGTLLIIDAVLSARNGTGFAALSDINMHIISGGRERTEAQFRELLESSGFQLRSVTPIHEWVALLEAAAA